MLTRTDARGIVTTYTYDVLNRPLTVSYSDGTPSVSYGYDAVANGVGQLASVTNSNSTTNFTAFDAMQGVTASSQVMAGQTFSFQYAYNLTEALTSETYPSLRTVTMTYDGANRPSALSGTYGGHGTNYVTGTSYLANGGITSLARGNNLIYGESYNNRGQLAGITEKLNGGNVWTLGLNWGNASTNNGTLQSTTTTGSGLTFNQTFTYDNLNRLATAGEGGNWAQSYSHDAWGNTWMPSTSLPAPVTGPSMPTANVYSASGAGNNRNVNSTYDAAGNLTVFGSVNVSYDAENRQKAAGSTIYLYDGLGQRLGKSTPANTAYVYDAFGWLAEGLTLGNPWQQDYIRFGGELLAVENNTAFTIQPPCATCYLTYDQLGSVRMVTDGNANVMAFHDYAPFGQEIPAGVGGRTSLWGGSDSASQRFTGQMRDTETYLDFFNARYLSSGLGRFMSVDPGNAGAVGADPQTWNGYGYVRNTPLSLVDPSGMSDDSPDKPTDPFDPCWDPYSVGNDSPCWGVGGGVGGAAGGGGGGGGGSNGGAAPGSQTASGGGPWPPGSFPGGETLGLPPGLSVPGPLGVGLPNPFIFSACPQSGCFTVIPPIFWTPSLGYVGAIRFLYDFLTGSGETNRQYGTNSMESVDLRRSGGFQTALRAACASGQKSGSFSVSTLEAGLYLPLDAAGSATGVQVGGYLGNYAFSGKTMNISIHNFAGANSFFYHGLPDRSSASGPFRTIDQSFSISLSNPCGN